MAAFGGARDAWVQLPCVTDFNSLARDGAEGNSSGKWDGLMALSFAAGNWFRVSIAMLVRVAVWWILQQVHAFHCLELSVFDMLQVTRIQQLWETRVCWTACLLDMFRNMGILGKNLSLKRATATRECVFWVLGSLSSPFLCYPSSTSIRFGGFGWFFGLLCRFGFRFFGGVKNMTKMFFFRVYSFPVCVCVCVCITRCRERAN